MTRSPDFLAGLPVIERQAALCEVIKNVLAIRPDQLGEVAGLLRPSVEFSVEEYIRIIALAIEQKCSVMSDDPYEKRDALVLEYGHTVGHALEVTMRGAMPHGIAVGIGMVVAARIGRLLQIADEGVERSHYELLEQLGAPTAIPAGVDHMELMARIRGDNKRGYLEPTTGARDLVLLEGLGRPRRTGQLPLAPVREEIITAAIRSCRAPAQTPSPSPDLVVTQPAEPRPRPLAGERSG